LASVKHDVIVLDIHQKKVDVLKDGISSIYEPELEPHLCEKSSGNIEDLVHGMGMDKRIEPHLLQAGIEVMKDLVCLKTTNALQLA
jgi:UDP-glucose 6-dehydrogenase